MPDERPDEKKPRALLAEEIDAVVEAANNTINSPASASAKVWARDVLNLVETIKQANAEATEARLAHSADLGRLSMILGDVRDVHAAVGGLIDERNEIKRLLDEVTNDGHLPDRVRAVVARFKSARDLVNRIDHFTRPLRGNFEGEHSVDELVNLLVGERNILFDAFNKQAAELKEINETLDEYRRTRAVFVKHLGACSLPTDALILFERLDEIAAERDAEARRVSDAVRELVAAGVADNYEKEDAALGRAVKHLAAARDRAEEYARRLLGEVTRIDRESATRVEQLANILGLKDGERTFGNVAAHTISTVADLRRREVESEKSQRVIRLVVERLGLDELAALPEHYDEFERLVRLYAGDRDATRLSVEAAHSYLTEVVNAPVGDLLSRIKFAAEPSAWSGWRAKDVVARHVVEALGRILQLDLDDERLAENVQAVVISRLSDLEQSREFADMLLKPLGVKFEGDMPSAVNEVEAVGTKLALWREERRRVAEYVEGEYGRTLESCGGSIANLVITVLQEWKLYGEGVARDVCAILDREMIDGDGLTERVERLVELLRQYESAKSDLGDLKAGVAHALGLAEPLGSHSTDEIVARARELRAASTQDASRASLDVFVRDDIEMSEALAEAGYTVAGMLPKRVAHVCQFRRDIVAALGCSDLRPDSAVVERVKLYAAAAHDRDFHHSTVIAVARACNLTNPASFALDPDSLIKAVESRHKRSLKRDEFFFGVCEALGVSYRLDRSDIVKLVAAAKADSDVCGKVVAYLTSRSHFRPHKPSELLAAVISLDEAFETVRAGKGSATFNDEIFLSALSDALGCAEPRPAETLISLARDFRESYEHNNRALADIRRAFDSVGVRDAALTDRVLALAHDRDGWRERSNAFLADLDRLQGVDSATRLTVDDVLSYLDDYRSAERALRVAGMYEGATLTDAVRALGTRVVNLNRHSLASQIVVRLLPYTAERCELQNLPLARVPDVVERLVRDWQKLVAEAHALDDAFGFARNLGNDRVGALRDLLSRLAQAELKVEQFERASFDEYATARDAFMRACGDFDDLDNEGRLAAFDDWYRTKTAGKVTSVAVDRRKLAWEAYRLGHHFGRTANLDHAAASDKFAIWYDNTTGKKSEAKS